MGSGTRGFNMNSKLAIALIYTIVSMLLMYTGYTTSNEKFVVITILLFATIGVFKTIELAVHVFAAPWNLLKPGDKVVYRSAKAPDKMVSTFLTACTFGMHAVIEHPRTGETTVHLSALRKAEPEEML